MNRLISSLTGTIDLLFPSGWYGNVTRDYPPESDDWQPDCSGRIAGWAERRRKRYPFGESRG